jgi:hypothetical protein
MTNKEELEQIMYDQLEKGIEQIKGTILVFECNRCNECIKYEIDELYIDDSDVFCFKPAPHCINCNSTDNITFSWETEELLNHMLWDNMIPEKK